MYISFYTNSLQGCLKHVAACVSVWWSNLFKKQKVIYIFYKINFGCYCINILFKTIFWWYFWHFHYFYSWTLLSNMLKHRSAAGVAVLDGEIYACGGHDGLSIFDSVSNTFPLIKYSWILFVISFIRNIHSRTSLAQTCWDYQKLFERLIVWASNGQFEYHPALCSGFFRFVRMSVLYKI